MARSGKFSASEAAMHISKSRYATVLQSHRRLWWEMQRVDAPELVPGVTTQAIFGRDTAWGLAREYVPSGMLIDLPHDSLFERVEATRLVLLGYCCRRLLRPLGARHGDQPCAGGMLLRGVSADEGQRGACVMYFAGTASWTPGE
jgi:hypothetical protein